MAEIEAGLEKHRGESIVLMSWGGAYMAAQQSAWLDPIMDKFGINVVTDSPGSYAKLRAMAETGNVTWHMSDYGTASGVANGLAGASEEIDRSVVDVRDWMDVVVNPWSGGGAITWAWNIAYSTETYPDGGPQPSSASDFWDVEKFPGDRGMHGAPRSWYVTLRFAQIGLHPELLDTAAGRATLTRLDQAQIDEAYVFLKEFKPNVTRWYAQVAECPQLLLSGEVDMCIVPGGRIVALALEGAPVQFCFSCGQLLITDYFAITKGLKAQDPVMYELAELLMAWMAFPETNVNIAKHINYGPVNLKSLSLLSGPEFDTYRPFLATAPETVGFSIIPDVVFDGTIGDAEVDRMATFLAE
jgi:putative spermidine/putrescine transport system substrate-binding protein